MYTLIDPLRLSHSNGGSLHEKTYANKQTLLKKYWRTASSIQLSLNRQSNALSTELYLRYEELDLTMLNIGSEIKETTESNTSASYLDWLLSIGRDSQLQFMTNATISVSISQVSCLEKLYSIFCSRWLLISQLIRLYPGLLFIFMSV